ncbi:MAG: hypothetical protein V7K53_02300 [Nostoc sp.]|uniref:hypothetical protein n=1 Tax=Nostoc sp. TaxID=1180 RepID=UPI002FF8C60C
MQRSDVYEGLHQRTTDEFNRSAIACMKVTAKKAIAPDLSRRGDRLYEGRR